MSYRTHLAQAIHNALMYYLGNPTESTLNSFKTALDNADEAALKEKSINLHSHLIDIFHLTKEIYADKSQAGDVAAQLFVLLMNACRRYPKTQASLLIAVSHEGFSPLHAVLMLGNAGSVKRYFKEVQYVYQSNIITKDVYRDLLMAPNSAGFTPIHDALKSGKMQNVMLYFNQVQRAHQEQIISKAAYLNLLVVPNSAGYTPLHQAAWSGSLNIVKFFVKELKDNLPSTQFVRQLNA